MHPDLSITWTACRVGKDRRYTSHDFISRFHRETALHPAGVLQRSADAVGPRLRVDYLGPSDAPLNKGGWAARKERLPAADSDASGAGAPAGAPPAAPAPSPAAAAGAGGAAPADAQQANAPAATPAGAPRSGGRGVAAVASRGAPRRSGRGRAAARIAASPAAAASNGDGSSAGSPSTSRLDAFAALIRARSGTFRPMRDNILQTNAAWNHKNARRRGISWFFAPHIWKAITTVDQQLARSNLFPDLPTEAEYRGDGIPCDCGDAIVSSIRTTLTNHDIPAAFANELGFERHAELGILCFVPQLQDWLIERLPVEVYSAVSTYVGVRSERDKERAGRTTEARASQAASTAATTTRADGAAALPPARSAARAASAPEPQGTAAAPPVAGPGRRQQDPAASPAAGRGLLSPPPRRPESTG